ncbi:MAG: hypothetical protein ABIR62_16840 [Dokdonella sp.]|uniref:hypothetical protein n=1 Tax=Dokdonella sp. TaxID=2291710 RepID=UPI0032630D42
MHAYVLLSNHVHLLLTPSEAGALSRMMHLFGRNYAGLFNGRHRRTRTLWEAETGPGVIFLRDSARVSSTNIGRV